MDFVLLISHGLYAYVDIFEEMPPESAVPFPWT